MCRKGHVADRDRWRDCRECKRERQREWKRKKHATNPEWAEASRKARREHYYSLSGHEYNALLLRQRRAKALKRIQERSQRQTERD